MAPRSPSQEPLIFEPLIPLDGERALIVGRTGSGKTGFAAWMLRRLPASPIVIYDTKGEAKFEALPKSAVFDNWPALENASYEESLDYLILRPPADELSSPAVLDEYLGLHYEAMPHIPAYVDELYSFQSHGQPRPGLTALLTRGRSSGITTIMSTQRPAWISRFTMSEAQKFYIFSLTMADDRKRVAEFVPGYDKLPQPPKFHFYVYNVEEGEPTLHAPVPLDKGIDTGYTAAQTIDRTEGQEGPLGEIRPRREWL